MAVPFLLELDARDRVSVRILLTAASQLRRGGLPSRSTRALNSLVQLQNAVAAAARHPQSLDSIPPEAAGGPFALLEDALRPVEQFLSTEGLDPKVRRRGEAIVDALRSFRCRHCEGDGSSPAACRAEFDEMFASIEKAVRELYHRWGAGRVPRPLDLHLAVSGIEGQAAAPFGAATSCCSFEDGNEPVSVVELSLARHHVTWRTLCGLPYLLCHELLCHAFQGLTCTGPRSPVGAECAWTEGWMDVLARDLTIEWSQATPQVSLGLARRDVEDETSALHTARTRKDLLGESTVSARVGSQEALTALENGYCRIGDTQLSRSRTRRARQRARERVLRFSIQLNLECLTPRQRKELSETFFEALDLLGLEMFDQLVSACEGYGAGGSLADFQNEIVRLTGVQLP